MGDQAAIETLSPAVAASLAATVIALKEAKAASAHVPDAPPWAWVFSVSTLILGWFIVQTVFTLHYAHRYFGDADADGEMDRGVKFPGDPPTSYSDFVYMAVCIVGPRRRCRTSTSPRATSAAW